MDGERAGRAAAAGLCGLDDLACGKLIVHGMNAHAENVARSAIDHLSPVFQHSTLFAQVLTSRIHQLRSPTHFLPV
jgi:hypothetical protein